MAVALQAGAPVTIWVKRTDVAGAQYTAVKGVDVLLTVDDFKARFMTRAKLDMDPSLVTLWRVESEARKPTPEQEQAATELEPFDTLAAAGVADGCKLLAYMAGGAPRKLAACSARFRVRLQALTRGVRAHVFPAVPPEPAAVGARAAVVDEADAYARALLAAAPGPLATAADVRRLLAQPPPLPVLVDASHATLLAEGAGCFPMQVRPPGRATAELETLLESAFRWHVSGGSEEVWASLADALVGRAWRTLSALSGTFAYVDDRNTVDRSGATQRRLRPDYCGWSNHVLVAKAEHKVETEELQKALEELASKTSVWNPIVMRNMPFLPCFAVGGHLIQFAIIRAGPGGVACVETVTEPMPMSSARGRLRVVAVAFNMFRIMAWLRARMPARVIPLYEEQRRADGSITVFDNYVLKRCCRVAPAAVYDALASGDIPCAVRVVAFEPPSAARPLARIELRPVAVETLPADEAELRCAVTAVLRALAALHARGFVHRDVRWPNVLADGAGGWLLVDFELADVAGALLPAAAVTPDAVAPEVRVPDAPYIPADDVWQVGRLLSSAGEPLSHDATALAAALMAPRAARLTAAQALAHPWLARGSAS